MKIVNSKNKLQIILVDLQKLLKINIIPYKSEKKTFSLNFYTTKKFIFIISLVKKQFINNNKNGPVAILQNYRIHFLKCLK